MKNGYKVALCRRLVISRSCYNISLPGSCFNEAVRCATEAYKGTNVKACTYNQYWVNEYWGHDGFEFADEIPGSTERDQKCCKHQLFSITYNFTDFLNYNVLNPNYFHICAKTP